MKTPVYVKEILKQVEADVKYFQRHGIVSDKLDTYKFTDVATIKAAWQDEDLKELAYKDKVKKIASLIVFPTDVSRLQAESLVEAAKMTDQDLTFADILKGKFDWSAINNTKADLVKAGYSAKQIRLKISQSFFGSP